MPRLDVKRVMEGVVLLAILVAPLVMLAALGKTRLWWLAGVGLVAGGFACFGQITHTEHGSPVGALEGLGNAIMTISGLALVIYGFIALVVAGNMRARAARRVEAPVVEAPAVEPLPAAYAIKLPSAHS